VIAATASEALHVLDGLLYHQSDVTVRRHHTEGGGDAEHVFALLALLGFQFAPRIPDLKNGSTAGDSKNLAVLVGL
jgi:TnpA family transposase